VRTTVLHRKNTRLTADITAAATTIYVQETASLPTVPFLAVINPENSSPEVVLVTAVNTTTDPKSITVVRAAMGTTAQIWLKDSVIHELGQKQIASHTIADVSSASTILVPMPKCFVVRVATILAGAITVGDATITIKKNTTSLGTITIATASSAAGDWDELLADGVAIDDFYFDGVDDYMHIETDGGSTGARKGEVMVEYIPY